MPARASIQALYLRCVLPTVLLCLSLLPLNLDARKRPTPSPEVKEALAAYDSFFRDYYEPELGVLSKGLTDRSRAAIWCQAIYWDMAQNAYRLSGEQKYLEQIKLLFEGAVRQYDNFNWANDREWFIYDDIMWWVISLARAYELTSEALYLQLAESGFHRVWYGHPTVGDNGAYDEVEGGLRWGWVPSQRQGKMACINFPTVVGAMSLYKITGQEDYLHKAQEIYGWARARLFNPQSGAVADHQNRGQRPNWKTHLYNQATFIGAGVLLYRQSRRQEYLQDAVLATNFVRDSMSAPKGKLPVEYGIEQGIYAAIFAQYLPLLLEELADTRPYLAWIEQNIHNEEVPTRGDRESYHASAVPALRLTYRCWQRKAGQAQAIPMKIQP